MTIHDADQLPVWTWRRIRNPMPHLWPQPWIAFRTPGQSGAASLITLHGYLGDDRARTIRRAVRAGRRKGQL